MNQKLKKIFSDFIWGNLKVFREKIKSFIFFFKIKKVQYNHIKAIRKVSQKKIIKVAFFLIHDADWKYEGLYHLMEKDKRFDPVVIVCPYITHGEEIMMQILDQSYNSFKNAGYQVINALNKKTGDWINVRKEIQPDIVCFTSPWNLTRPEYLISKYLDTLTCYVPYGYKVSYLFESHFNRPIQNLVWKFFLETDIHKKLAQQYSRNGASNTVVTGYPGMDKFIKKNDQEKDVWKIKDKKIKRIIWAPHHSLPGYESMLDYSTFLIYAEFMFEIANKYKNNIQIAFKPHPILRINLSKNDVWGKDKTDEYYLKWANLPNGQLNEGEYLDLFFTSDAMIHDSGSFLIEYLYINKPVMFLWNDDLIPDRFNEIGKMALLKLYRGNTEKDIERFILKVIINGEDSMQIERLHFFKTIITAPNNISASENIFNYIKTAIFNN